VTIVIGQMVVEINTKMDYLAKLIPWLWNPYVGTGLFVITLGYIVRAVPQIANSYIPLIGIVLGSIFFTIVSNITIAANPDHPIAWGVLRWGVGVVVSAIAWLAHRYLLSYAEDWIGKRVPAVGNWLEKTSDSNTTNTKP